MKYREKKKHQRLKDRLQDRPQLRAGVWWHCRGVVRGSGGRKGLQKERSMNLQRSPDRSD